MIRTDRKPEIEMPDTAPSATTPSAPAFIPVDPVVLVPRPSEGRLEGSNERYEKFLPDLHGVYRDRSAFAERLADDSGAPVYWVESSRSEPGPGGLITGTSVLEPGRVGDEYAVTRGHLHQISDRSELYLGLAGRGVMLLETVDGRAQALEMTPGVAVYVPGNWIHRSVNVGADRFVTLFCYASDAGQDYGIIEEAGGMQQLVVATPDGGWTTKPNPDHTGYRTT